MIDYRNKELLCAMLINETFRTCGGNDPRRGLCQKERNFGGFPVLAPSAAPVSAAQSRRPRPSRQASAAPAWPSASAYPNAATKARIAELLTKNRGTLTLTRRQIQPSPRRTHRAAEVFGTPRHPEGLTRLQLTIEGHCDERGSDEYNLALGDKRAEAKDYLVQVGILAAPFKVISYGKPKLPHWRSTYWPCEACAERQRSQDYVDAIRGAALELASGRKRTTPCLSRPGFL